MFNTVVGLLLVLVVGMCVLAFPFVVWMLFGSGHRSQHARGNATASSRWREDHQKIPPRYGEAKE